MLSVAKSMSSQSNISTAAPSAGDCVGVTVNGDSFLAGKLKRARRMGGAQRYPSSLHARSKAMGFARAHPILQFGEVDLKFCFDSGNFFAVHKHITSVAS